MSTVTIGVASLGDTQRRLSAAFRGKKQGGRAVHSDIHVLLRAGVLDKAEDGGVVFPL
jgi:hypothetical protein